MFIRKRHNKSKTTSVQIVRKTGKSLKIIKHIGTASNTKELNELMERANDELKAEQISLFSEKNPVLYDNFLENLQIVRHTKVGFFQVFGKAFDELGYNTLELGENFRSIIIARIANPVSKLHLSRWLNEKANIQISDDQIYRIMDKITPIVESKANEVTFKSILKYVGGEIHMVFFDATTLHFETFKGDNLRMCGFSKVGKHNQPQLVIGLIVTKEGLPIGYRVFPGNRFDGHTIREALVKVSKAYNVKKVTFVADAGMMSKKNVKIITSRGFNFIMSAKLHSIVKGEQEDILNQNLHSTGKIYETNIYMNHEKYRLIVTYSENRALQDKRLRDEQITRLKRNLASKVKITKTKVGKIGKSKYIRVVGNASAEIDYEAIMDDSKWDGLKGFVTNISKIDLNAIDIVARYTDLYQVEEAFRVSKQELKIRPVFHFKSRRVKAHILITFLGLVILKYIVHKIQGYGISAKMLIEEVNWIMDTTITHSKASKTKVVKGPLSENMELIYKLLNITR